jgi:hypothetical protein
MGVKLDPEVIGIFRIERSVISRTVKIMLLDDGFALDVILSDHRERRISFVGKIAL